MSYSITLYNNTTDRRGINKNLTEAQVILGVELKLPTNISHPTFILRKPQNINFNYCYAPSFNRYYFVDSPTLLKGGMIEINCHVDVLESFKSSYLERTCYIERCEKQFNDENSAMSTFFDNEFPIRSDCTFTNIDVGNVASGNSYIITVNGGVQ